MKFAITPSAVAATDNLCAPPDPAGRPLISYQLLIEVARPLRLQVGRFGCFEFPAGLYCYTGSAKRNLLARVRRHLATEKRLRWHIDYLLTAPGVRVLRATCLADAECALNQAVVGTIPVPGFGASDCRQHCGSHLKRVGDLA
ncbi:MAG: hypothetical protein RIR00_2475 [Pseudomonadota bacterium]|jgi:Uri superfamily endonuclease